MAEDAQQEAVPTEGDVDATPAPAPEAEVMRSRGWHSRNGNVPAHLLVHINRCLLVFPLALDCLHAPAPLVAVAIRSLLCRLHARSL